MCSLRRDLEHEPARHPAGHPGGRREAASPVNSGPVNSSPQVAPATLLTPARLLALQRSAGNHAVQELLSVQLGRTNVTQAKIRKERARKAWKKTRLWPEHHLKGRILERTDKYLFRKSNLGYVDMNKVASNFPAIDGIANGRFRQVKAYLHLGKTAKARNKVVAQIIKQAEALEDKCEIAAERMISNKGLLLRQIVAIHRGRSGTKGRTGLAPYNEGSKTKRARAKHTNVLPPTFATLAETQIAAFDKAPKIFEFDKDRLAQEILKNMVLVVPNELVSAVRKELKGSMVVEGGGMTSTQVRSLMDVEGFTVSKPRGGDDDDADYKG